MSVDTMGIPEAQLILKGLRGLRHGKDGNAERFEVLKKFEAGQQEEFWDSVRRTLIEMQIKLASTRAGALAAAVIAIAASEEQARLERLVELGKALMWQETLFEYLAYDTPTREQLVNISGTRTITADCDLIEGQHND